MNLLDYYKKNKLNPTRLAIEEKGVYDDLVRKRINLYVNKLKIPRGFWAGKNVLEVGCSSGENALVLASLGAQFTFIEPNPGALLRLNHLFSRAKFSSAIKTSWSIEIEKAKIAVGAYDACIAEGFLCTLSSRSIVLQKLFKSIKPGGLLIISTVDPVGCFSEYVKKFIFTYLWRSTGASSLKSQLNIASQLFLKDYQAVPHSRDFELWIRDMFLNPLFELNYMWSIREILKHLDSRARIFSSWPSMEHASNMSWYKKIEAPEAEKERMLAAYTLRLPAFFHGKTLPEGHGFSESNDVCAFERSVLAIMKRIHYYHIGTQAFDALGLHKEIKTLSRIACRLKEKPLLLPIIRDVERLILNPSVTIYKKSSALRKCWGVICPYYAFERI